ncbi:MAG: hypothetical protein KAS72_07540 [Phycisphaerales bacterium]|nr:hypothetical protein [Phycisphaerales bacterium]
MADPVGSIVLRQFDTATGGSEWQYFGALAMSETDHVAVAAGINGSADYDTLIWHFDGVSGSVAYREGFVTVLCHPIQGNDFTVKVGQIIVSGVNINSSGEIAYRGQLRVTCEEPDDPACDYDGRNAFFIGDEYAFGGADAPEDYICDLGSHNTPKDACLDDLGRAFGRLKTTGLNAHSNVAVGNCAAPTAITCYGDELEGTVGQFGKFASELYVVPSTLKYYCVNNVLQVPSTENVKVILNGEAILSESDSVTLPDKTTVTIAGITDVAISFKETPLWIGTISGAGITTVNNDVVSYGGTIIAHEGDPFDAIPNSVFGVAAGNVAPGLISTDDDCHIAYTWVVTYDPGGPDEELLQILVYNGELVLATNDLIDQNGDGQVNEGDYGAYLVGFHTDIAVNDREIWFIGDAHTSLGDRMVVMSLTSLPEVDNPWCDQAEPCVGDINGDGYRNQNDLGILLACYDLLPVTPECEGADLDNDGDVDQQDLGIFLAVYDIPCP